MLLGVEVALLLVILFDALHRTPLFEVLDGSVRFVYCFAHGVLDVIFVVELVAAVRLGRGNGRGLGIGCLSTFAVAEGE